MRKILITIVFLFIIFPLFFIQKASASSLQITGLGSMDVSGLDLGGSLKSYTYSNGTFNLVGLASPSASISIVIDDVTQTATADAEGSWSNSVSSLIEGDHQFSLLSGDEELDFVLTIGSTVEATGSEEATGTSETLPAAGSITTSIIFLALALLSVGLGFAIQTKRL
jgi:hypothetical protein